MASVPQIVTVLVLAASILCSVEGSLSTYNKATLAKIIVTNKEVSEECQRKVSELLTTHLTEPKMDRLCMDIRSAKDDFLQNCTATEFSNREEFICSLVHQSEKIRATMLANLMREFVEMSFRCKEKVKDLLNLRSEWYFEDREKFCWKYTGTEKQDFQENCSDEEYGSVKGILCPDS